MLFSKVEFLVFFFVVFNVYWLLGRRAQNVLLLIASYVFYGAWDWRFLGLLLVSTVVDFACGLGLEKLREDGQRRALLMVSVATNLGLLGAFKYLGWFVNGLVRRLDAVGWDVDVQTLQIVLPVGISFYTFQTLSYTIDVYRGTQKPTRNLLDFALFVSFFPQLVAGPIERAGHMFEQFAKPRQVDSKTVIDGLTLAAWGMVKKVVLADTIAVVIEPVTQSPAMASSLELALTVILFTMQIYGDFSGYTDIARGVARTMGFELTLNFRRPYFSKGPIEFWTRWHMSLSSWFADYLYYPLAMFAMRRSSSRLATYLPHFVAMGLIGLWHGASLNFVWFGLYWGAVIVLSIMLRGRIKLSASASVLLNILTVMGGWFLFLFNSPGTILLMHKWGLSLQSLTLGPMFWFAVGVSLVVLGVDALDEFCPERSFEKVVASPRQRLVGAWLLGTACVLLRPPQQVDFIYFQF